MKRVAAVMGMFAALLLPAVGQHGGAHGGSGGRVGSAGHGGSAGRGGFSGSGGFAGHSGFAGRSGFAGGRPGFSGSRNGWPGAQHGYGAFTTPGLMPGLPSRSGYRMPYNGAIGQHRGPYRGGFGDHRGRGGDRDHDRWRRGGYRGGYGYGYAYPGASYYPYPYVIDPGLYDWGATGNYNEDQGNNYQGAYNQEESGGYPEYGDNGSSPYGDGEGESAPIPYMMPPPPYRQAPMARPEYGGGATPAPEEPLTVMFKDGRAPEKMQNYMMNSKTLTDMDPQHYKRIPLDEIDIAATMEINRANGVEFSVPGSAAE